MRRNSWLECKYKLSTGCFSNKSPGEQFARGGSIPPVPLVTHQETWVMFARILLGCTDKDSGSAISFALAVSLKLKEANHIAVN